MGARITSYAVVVGIAIVAAVVTVAGMYGGELPVPDVAFLSTLFALLGVAVRAAWIGSQSARRAAQHARATAARTVEGAVRTALLEERARMSADIDAVVRGALVAIRSRTTAIEEYASGTTPPGTGSLEPRDAASFDGPAALREIQDAGRLATVKLRGLLDLLRSSSGGDVGPPDAVPQPTASPRPLGLPDLLPGLLAVTACGIEVWLAMAEGRLSPVGAALSIVTAAASVWWRRDPGRTLMLQALAVGAGLLIRAPVELGLWSVLAFALPMWRVIATPAQGPFSLIGPVALAAAASASQWIFSEENVGILVVVLGAAAATGLASRAFDSRRRRSAERATAREAELRRMAAEAVRHDRIATARELHDAISGTIGVIVMQAGAAELRWDTDRPAALRSVAVISSSADQAVRELDELVPRLADAELGGSILRGLRDLPALVERMARAGVELSASLPDPLPSVPPHIAATAYRIVQECVANAARHAPGSRIDVRVTMDGRTVDVSVVDDGPVTTGATHSGYGLRGLAERVAELGGEFAAGPGSTGGFRVEARLPIARRQETTA
ncbi:ATP-binding protein [Agromyces sp. C10]|uniref:sensor histidine kinase n=1 Tax=Agromyces sp. C10 TaxID=2935077 RepID=UPI00200A52DB|nr:ATP-binding protein [Agromyces sp. C10]MCK8609864.1 histidine kinase [Agromyces sp. C10]